MFQDQLTQAHDRAFRVTKDYRTKQAKAALSAAIAQGNTRMIERLNLPLNGLPSIEELEAEFGGDFLQKFGGVEEVSSPHDCAAGCALDEHHPIGVPLDALGLLHLEGDA